MKQHFQSGLNVPLLPVFFLLVWAWGGIYYADVLRMAREESFWVADTNQMRFLLDQPFGMLWYVGRMLLQTARYPWMAALCLAALLTTGSALTNYLLPRRSVWQGLKWLPALSYMGWMSYQGLDLFFETETGRLMGLPLLGVALLAAIGLLKKAFMYRKQTCIPPTGHRHQKLWQVSLWVVGLTAIIGFTEIKRPYVRVISGMMVAQKEQDWERIIRSARAHAQLSNRPMAAYYAIALGQTGQIGERLYDIRLDFDPIHLHGWNGSESGTLNLYQAECNFYAGLVEPAYHYVYEKMTLSGPTVRALELMVKCALLREEWALARKYLRILSDVPFEKRFCKQYGSMVGHDEQINQDSELAAVRALEPTYNLFENHLQQPVFIGYNLTLQQGRSPQALMNSLAVCLYAKKLPEFAARLTPFYGTTPPENVADGILLATPKQRQLEGKFNGLDLRGTQLGHFMQDIQPYLKERDKHAASLFEQYKGYYPYYYIFGNLKATKSKPDVKPSHGKVN